MKDIPNPQNEHEHWEAEMLKDAVPYIEPEDETPPLTWEELLEKHKNPIPADQRPKPWYEIFWEERKGTPYPKPKVGRPRKEGLSKEDYEALGIPWTATREYHRERQRAIRAKNKALREQHQATIDAMLAQKKALNLDAPLKADAKIEFHPTLAPDGIPWDIPDSQLEGVTDPDSLDKLLHHREREAWRQGLHSRQRQRKSP